MKHIDFNLVTQVLVIDKSKKGYPFFELMVSAGKYDKSSYTVFYTEDESLIKEARSALISSDQRVAFLTKHKDCIYDLTEAGKLFGLLSDCFLRDISHYFYDPTKKQVLLLKTNSPRPSKATNLQEQLNQNELQKQAYYFTESLGHPMEQYTFSLFAFKDMPQYHRNKEFFDEMVALYNSQLMDLWSALTHVKSRFNLSVQIEQENLKIGVHPGLQFLVKKDNSEFVLDESVRFGSVYEVIKYILNALVELYIPASI